MNKPISTLSPQARYLTVNTRMFLPWRLQTGVAFRMRPDLWWEVDLDWIGWSYNDSLTIYQANGTISSPTKAPRHYWTPYGSHRSQMGKSPRLTLHAGIGYDPTPVPERDASPTTTFLKTRLAFGARYKLERDAKIDIAYQFIQGISAVSTLPTRICLEVPTPTCTKRNIRKPCACIR